MATVTGKNSEIAPIKWEKYVGEERNINIRIKNGKKTFETQWYPDRVKAEPRGNAYIIGNGPSRKDFDLTQLKDTGQTYGCNALYRDFIPDYIFSVDSKITLRMVEDEVYKKCIHYAPALEVNRHPPLPTVKRKTLNLNSHLHLIPNNPAWISGSAAMWTACVHGHKNIFLIGFDFREYGKDKLNNIYQDTKHYGPRHSDTIFDGWLQQFRRLQRMRPYCNFNVVHDSPPDYIKVSNPSANLGKFKIYSYKEFTDKVINQAP
jgi:hypothetical protein